MSNTIHSHGRVLAAFAAGAILASAGTATAARLITGKQIKNGTITERDLSASVRAKLAKVGATGPAGAPGASGAPGAKGDTGATGPAGGFRASSITLVNGPSATYPDTFPGGVVPHSNATCPEGSVAIAGFWDVEGSFYAEPVPWVTSRRVTERIWQVSVQQPMSYPGDFTYHATAVCAAP